MPTSVRNAESIDIVVQFAPEPSPIAKSEARVVFEHSPECSLICIQGVADFQVSRGKQICVWPAAGATQKDIEIFLFGPAWAALCHQRGLLPLHASAIVTRGGITAFAGDCGAGKSTTAALMGLLGYALVADDILPISFNRHAVPGAWPYLCRLKLHTAAITELALAASDPVSETLDNEKYFVIPKLIAARKWTRLERVYVLQSDQSASEVSIDRIVGAEAICALVDQTYHFQSVVGSGRLRSHFAFCAQLASKIPVYRLRRSASSDIGRELGALIEAHLETSPS